MITLKKSFEVQNYLRGLSNEVLSILSYPSNVTKVTQEHKRKKAYAEAEDEIIIKPKTTELSVDTNCLVNFALYLQGEIEKLTIAINKAKAGNDCDFDSMISINNCRRNLLNRLISMSNIKASETTTIGRANKFNGEGNQVSYNYDIKEITTIDFDRNRVRSIINRLRKEADEMSTKIDLMQLEAKVDFELALDIGDNLEDAIEKWKEINK